MMVARYFEHLAMKGGPGGRGGRGRRVTGDAAREDRSPAGRRSWSAASPSTGPSSTTQLTKLSQNWRLERMAIVERNVIRIALYELQYCEDVPVNVVLNEAIELAKRYGTSEGAAFTNGLLDRAVGELGIRR